MPVTLINPFEVAAEREPAFLQNWKQTAAVFAGKPGYLDTCLHVSIDPASRFRFVNIAHWRSAGDWAEAMKTFPPAEGQTHGVQANPALYMPVADGSIEPKRHSIKEAIHELEDSLARAYQANDAASLALLLDDDYVVTDGPGTVSDKAKVLSDHRTKRLRVSSFRYDDMQIRALGPEAAIVTGQYTWVATYDGHPIPGGTFRYLRVYAREGAGWRVKAGQVTPVLPRP